MDEIRERDETKGGKSPRHELVQVAPNQATLVLEEEEEKDVQHECDQQEEREEQQEPI